MHALVRLQAKREQYFATFFLRNRPELELMRRLIDQKASGSTIKVSVLACSKGAEVYSMTWILRSARPDLKLSMYAVDISQEIVDFAEKGVYSLSNSDALDTEAAKEKGDVSRYTSRDQNAWIFERVSKDEIDAMFDVKDKQASIKSEFKEGITWLCRDAGDTRLRAEIGLQDIIVANRFLCHMKPEAAEACLRNIAKMIRPGGYLFVSGIDLDVRTRVALEMGWQPMPDLLREIHDGDDSIRRGWPLEYWGLEPLNDRREDWQTRYASVFQVGENVPCESLKLASAECAGR